MSVSLLDIMLLNTRLVPDMAKEKFPPSISWTMFDSAVDAPGTPDSGVIAQHVLIVVPCACAWGTAVLANSVANTMYATTSKLRVFVFIELTIFFVIFSGTHVPDYTTNVHLGIYLIFCILSKASLLSHYRV